MVDHLTKNQKEILRAMVNYYCQNCHKHERKVGVLEPHRIKRKNIGGEYVPNNILMLCNGCHKKIHSGEW